MGEIIMNIVMIDDNDFSLSHVTEQVGTVYTVHCIRRQTTQQRDIVSVERSEETMSQANQYCPTMCWYACCGGTVYSMSD